MQKFYPPSVRSVAYHVQFTRYAIEQLYTSVGNKNMNLETLSVKAKVAAFVASAATLTATALTVAPMTTAPAQAATFTYTFSGGPANPYVFSGPAPLINVTANTGNVVQGSDGLGIWQGGLDSFQVDGLGANEILSLTFNQTVRVVSATFRRVGTDLVGLGLLNDDFRLLVDGVSVLTADIPGGNILDTGTGTFNFSPSIAQGSVLGFGTVDFSDDYFLSSVTVETIPTPALLPGLLAMGAAALRKRKSEVAEESSEA